MRIEDNFAKKEILFNNRFHLNSDKATANTNEAGFGDVLKKALNDTNDRLAESDTAMNAFVRGDDVNIDEVMIKNQEAALSLQFLTQTRDKLLEGYDTLSKLQL